MWESSCSRNAQETNLQQFFAVVHLATPESFTWKFKENNLAKVSFLKLLIKENLLACFN